jgi:N-acetylglucosaminyl-diphospho-decaprenol L-rhamnosyltransferase
VLVIIVSYRSAPLVVRCLHSIALERARLPADLEVLVVDNASGDAPEIQAELERTGLLDWVTLTVAARNGGFGYGNNLGFELGFALEQPPDYFHLLNPDTEVRPGGIGEILAFMQERPEVGIAGSSFEDADGSDWSTAFRFPSLLGEIENAAQWGLASRLLERYRVPRTMHSVAQKVDWVVGASMMVRREVIEDVGGFDEQYFLYYEETDLCRRARLAGWPTWYVPQSRVMHIAGQSTKVKERNTAPKRLPTYVLDSRRRYFAVNHGLRYACAADVAAIVATALGAAKRLALGRPLEPSPHYFADFLQTTVLRKANREVPPAQVFRPDRERHR